MTRTTTPSAPTDPDATVPGHLPNELPPSASLDEEAWVPGRWFPNKGEPLTPREEDELGDVDEGDERMEGDGAGIPSPNDDDDDLAQHLRGDDDKTSLGSPPEEKPTKGRWDEVHDPAWLRREIRRFMLQENPAGAGMVDPSPDKPGFYTPFDMVRDHTGTDDPQDRWYRSPGRQPGTDGDPFRGPDPYAQLGFHAPQGADDPGTTPPGAEGEEGVAARETPAVGELTMGDDTSKLKSAPQGGTEKPAQA